MRTLLLGDILVRFHSKCIQIYEIDSACFADTRINMRGMSEKERSRVRATEGCCYAAQSRKKHQG